MLVIWNRSSLGRAAAMSVTWQSSGFCPLSSLVTHPDFLRVCSVTSSPLAVVTRHLKICFAAGVNFGCLTLSLYSSLSGDCGLAEVLAKNSQSQRGDVFKWAGRDPGCDWAIRVCESYGALVQAAGQMCLQPTLPGRLQIREEIEHWLVIHPHVRVTPQFLGLYLARGGVTRVSIRVTRGEWQWDSSAWALPKRKQRRSVEPLLLLCAVLQQAGAGAQVLCHVLFWPARAEEIHPGSPYWSKSKHSAVLERGQPKTLCWEGPLFYSGTGSKEWGVLESVSCFHWR